MEIRVFYAWQSDCPGKLNRFLIRDAAKDACDRITADKSNSWQVLLDSDTQGEAGMCDIPNTILTKIENSEIVLADLTLVGDITGSREKRLPNPNVVFELGYAASQIGFPRLIGVMNEAFGKIDGQMFDTKRRGCLFYTAGPDLDRKAIDKVKDQLSGRIEEVIRLTITKEVIPLRAEVDRKLSVDRIKIRDGFVDRVMSGMFYGSPQMPEALITIQAAEPFEATKFEALYYSIKAEGLKAEVNENSIYWIDDVHVTEIDFSGKIFHVYHSMDRAVKRMTMSVGNRNAPLAILTENIQQSIVRQANKFGNLLGRELGCKPPWYFSVSIVGAERFCLMNHDSREASPRMFGENIVHLPPVILESLEQVGEYYEAGAALYPMMMALCRKVGMVHNPCYTQDGVWNQRF